MLIAVERGTPIRVVWVVKRELVPGSEWPTWPLNSLRLEQLPQLGEAGYGSRNPHPPTPPDGGRVPIGAIIELGRSGALVRGHGHPWQPCAIEIAMEAAVSGHPIPCGAISHHMVNPRMTVTFTEPQMDYLRKEAERLGITVADMVRRIVDAHRLQ